MGKSLLDNDNESRQKDPENDSYWQSRGYEKRPEDWEERVAAEDAEDE
ncbi:MAG: hypothetical protein V3U49_02450 [Nitrososphaerales archaeon]